MYIMRVGLSWYASSSFPGGMLHTELFYHPYLVFLIFAIPTLVTFLMYWYL